MADDEARTETILALHPSPAARLAPRGRVPVPFYERLVTPVRLRRIPPGASEPLSHGAVPGGHAHHRFEGLLWRSLSTRSRPDGPATAVDEAEFRAFLEGRSGPSLLADLLRYTPLVASRPAPDQAGRPPWTAERGEDLPEGHRVVAEERERTARRLRAFLEGEVISLGHRVLVRVHPVLAVWAGQVGPAYLPDPTCGGALAVPAGHGRALAAALGHDGGRVRALARGLAPACDGTGPLREAINQFARAALVWFARAERCARDGERAAMRAALAPARGPWEARCRFGGVEVEEGAGLVESVRRAAEAALPHLDLPPAVVGSPFPTFTAAARTVLVPLLLAGRTAPEEDLAALAAL